MSSRNKKAPNGHLARVVNLSFRVWLLRYVSCPRHSLLSKLANDLVSRSVNLEPPMRTTLAFAVSAVLCLVTGRTFAQPAEVALQSIPSDQRAWVNRSCPRSLGPSLWSACVEREVRALKGGQPDLSNLTEVERSWAQRSCPPSLGPSLSIACLTRESNALRAGMPSLNQLTGEKRAWVQQSCPQSLGPSLYKACAEREARVLASGAASPIDQAPPRSVQTMPGAVPRARSARRADIYPIETAYNDELFIINGEKFEAKTYCFNMEEDDEVIFLEGSPFGACVSAKLLNLRTREKCEVWCE